MKRNRQKWKTQMGKIEKWIVKNQLRKLEAEFIDYHTDWWY